jgi:restriction system protein
VRVAPATPSLSALTFAEQFASISAQADHLIERSIADLGPARVRLLVAGMLRAMGFPHRVLERPDGAEVFTPAAGAPERTLIVLRVHPRPEEPLGASTALAFCEGLHAPQRGLLVALGGFTPAAREAAAPHSARCSLLDLPELRRTLLDHYDRMDLESRSLLPLTRIHWPVRS